MGLSPTIYPAEDFDPEKDATALREALKGFGTDEEAVIDIITKRSNEQRIKIAHTFKTMYGKDLIEDLKSELGGNFEDVIMALMTETKEYLSEELHNAISGLGTDETAIVEILSTHDNDDVREIAEKYESLYHTSLEDAIIGDTSGTVKRILVSLSTGNRDESDQVDEEEAQRDVRELLQAGELHLGTHESVFNAILCQRNRSQLLLIFKEYEKLTGNTIEEAIENEFSGTSKEILLALIQSIRDRFTYLATKLHASMNGFGTDDNTLIRIVVSRSENDLGDIKNAFMAKYDKSLAESIKDLIEDLKSELHNHFEDVIVALLTDPIEYLATQLHEAISGAGTDEGAIVEILSTHDNYNIKKITEKYEELYEKSVEDAIIGDTSGTVKRILVSLTTGCRDESGDINQAEALEDAQKLYEAGESGFGTDEATFNAVLCRRSRNQLKITFSEYEKLTGNTIEDAIDNEFSGSSKDTLLALVQSLKNCAFYFATKLHDSLSGIGTDDSALIRIIVSRSEIDLGDIKEAYHIKYEQSLAEKIEGDCSSDYKRALLSIVG